MSDNSNLNRAKKAKYDEFYTRYEDIEKEMAHYTEYFGDKVIYCNTDTPRSNFVRYFADHFDEYGLRRLIATGMDYQTGQGWLYDLRSGQKEPYITAIDSGDYKAPGNIERLKQADIVITNPPFSKFREYMALMFEHNKKFLVIGNINAVTYKEIFPLIKENKLWLGVSIHSGDREFRVPDSYILPEKNGEINEKGEKFIKVSGIRWFTNIPHNRLNIPINLYKQYKPSEFPNFDNYDAINVDRTKDIPRDWYGVMGVPITFLDKWCPVQFEITGKLHHGKDNEYDYAVSSIGGKKKYMRILIRRNPEFEIIGRSEDSGKGLSNGLHADGTDRQPLVDKSKKYKRIFIRRTDFPDDGTIYSEKDRL